MANPYILHSRLTEKEVQNCVWNLVWFQPYAKIFSVQEKSPQALRPVLSAIERRMYFELDEWPLFHMLELPKHNLNKEFSPYTDHMSYVSELALQVPRSANSKMKTGSEKINFRDEVDCLFSCPHHVPPAKFVKRYGYVKVVQNFGPTGNDEECHTRIGLKKVCDQCQSIIRPILCERQSYIFRHAMEYAALWGKPKYQYVDLFMARLVYHLVWKGYEVNLRLWLVQMQLLAQAKARKLPPTERETVVKKARQDDFRKAENLHQELKKHLARMVLDNLRDSPVRIDRRKVYEGS